MKIEELNFSKALYFALKRAKIDDVETILTMRRCELKKLRWLGEVSIREIEEILMNYGGGYPLKE